MICAEPLELDCIPGRLEAKFLNNCFTFIPVLADVSINYIVLSNPYSLAKLAPSSYDTWRFSSSSNLLPTNTIIISSPLWLRASWIHFGTFSNELRAIKKNYVSEIYINNSIQILNLKIFLIQNLYPLLQNIRIHFTLILFYLHVIS